MMASGSRHWNRASLETASKMDASFESAYKEATNDYTRLHFTTLLEGMTNMCMLRLYLLMSSFTRSLLHLFNDSLLTSILSVVSAISVYCARLGPACGRLKGAFHKPRPLTRIPICDWIGFHDAPPIDLTKCSSLVINKSLL